MGSLALDATGAGAPPEDVEVSLESLSQWQLAFRRFKLHKMALIGLAAMTIIVLIAVFGPIILPYDPNFIPNAHKPGGDPPVFPSHIFGTDNVGRDVFSMVVNGARVSVAIGAFSMLIAGLVGVVVGAVAGYMGGFVDNVLMRIVDVFFAIPSFFLILVAARFFGQGELLPLILIFGLLSWPFIARLVRALFLTLREADYVEAAKAVGVGDTRIAFRHILPSALGPVIVAMTLTMGGNITAEAFVSFLGFGLKETTTSWGNALANAQTVLSNGNWWWAFFPGMAIALTVLSINFIGDGLRDALDPRSRL
jgi:ABC-type dipeptide/oligopeptide/nickel transport system permease subunit